MNDPKEIEVEEELFDEECEMSDLSDFELQSFDIHDFDDVVGM